MSHRNIFYYDNRDNLTCVRDPDLGLTYYTYDAGSRMTSVKNPFGEVTYYEYSPGGRLQKRTLGNGAVTYYEYDAIGRTTKVENRKSDMNVISSFEYERDAAGNPVSIQREDEYTVYYEYDAKHQLTAETHVDDGSEIYAWEWDYDAAGNREYEDFNGEVTYYEYNAGNELISETTGGETTYYEYDRCGNTTAKQEPSGTTYYHWDHENLMTRLDLPDGGHNYFAYDADSKRVQKRDSEGFTEFIYQGPDMLKLQQERDENGDTKAQYTMGAGVESMRRADGADITTGDSSFYHFDQLGSTFNLTDENESITDTYLYNAWGEVLDRTGTTTNPHTYVGKERYYRAVAAALYHLGFREYAQELGRFITVDPLALFVSVRRASSVYAYVRNRVPVSIDPDGLERIGFETCMGNWGRCKGEAGDALGDCVKDVIGVSDIADPAIGLAIGGCAALCALTAGGGVGAYAGCVLACVLLRAGIGYVVGLRVCEDLYAELYESCIIAYSACCGRLDCPSYCLPPGGGEDPWKGYPPDMWHRGTPRRQ